MSINKDQVNGRAKQVGGKLKEFTGRIVGDPRLERAGMSQKILGTLQAKYGDIRHAVRGIKKGA
jgi:uncharacterized protein YjbJ (UPF0337 family)